MASSLDELLSRWVVTTPPRRLASKLTTSTRADRVPMVAITILRTTSVPLLILTDLAERSPREAFQVDVLCRDTGLAGRGPYGVHPSPRPAEVDVVFGDIRDELA
jgi:hypothetical protein